MGYLEATLKAYDSLKDGRTDDFIQAVNAAGIEDFLDLRTPFELIAQALMQCPSLERLRFQTPRLPPYQDFTPSYEHVTLLADALKRNTTLKSLAFDGVPMPANGMAYFAASVADMCGLRDLSLRNTPSAADWIAPFAASLAFNTSLKWITLDHVGLKPKSMEVLLQGLRHNQGRIEKLTLSVSTLQECESFLAAVGESRHRCQGRSTPILLKELDLSPMTIHHSDGYCVALCKVIRNSDLTTLRVRGNKMSSSHFDALIDAMEESLLVELYLRDAPLSEQQRSRIAKASAANTAKRLTIEEASV